MGEEEQKRPKSLAGHFLISEADLMDPNFYRTVVLMVEHNEDGAFGLVVNRLSNVTLGEVLEEAEESEIAELPIYVGGPVEQQYLFTLHSGLPAGISSEHATSPAPGIVFEPLSHSILAYLTDEWPLEELEERPIIHVYAGYSGWGPRQLEGELESDAWLHHLATPDIVFRPDPQEGWKDALGKKGAFYQIVAETGYKPSMN
ncbi:MAG: YqgE/AlgH family protein [Spirochaetaceae bacterium]